MPALPSMPVRASSVAAAAPVPNTSPPCATHSRPTARVRVLRLRRSKRGSARSRNWPKASTPLPQVRRAVNAAAPVNKGLAPLVSLDLGGAIMAAATDMISYMDFGGHLAQEFQAYRASLGMPPDVLYFNNGLTVIDRAAWAKAELGERTLRFIEANPALCLRFEQSALNALLKGDVAKLSPRFNFMGDFMRLDLESEIRPNVYHFVNRPKPWPKGW